MVNKVVVGVLKITGKKIAVACISNCRDAVDVRRFGFTDENFPDVLPWVVFSWNDIWGQLFMIGSITDHIAGDTASRSTIERARSQFIKAVTMAISNGADTVLYAATTKRLFQKGELESLFPKVLFTLGDNFTGLLLGETIVDAFKRSNLKPQECRVLLIGPYGLLGGVSLHYLLRAGCELVVMGNLKRKEQLEAIMSTYHVTGGYSFNEVGCVDMVVACNSSPNSKITKEQVEMLRKKGKKLILIDPNEPQNMTPESFAECNGTVLRYDAGNGMSKNLKYVLGGIAASVLRLTPNVIWGCFCEALIIAANWASLSHIDWYEVSLSNISVINPYFGECNHQISISVPLNFNKCIREFSLDIKEPKA